MSAEIERHFTVQAGVYFEKTFLMNIYDFTLNMEIQSESIREQNVAMERIKYLLFHCLENSVFIHEAETGMIAKFTDCGIKLCITPEEPYDQIIALVLLLKLAAITEGKLIVTDIKLTSTLSDDVLFREDMDTARDTLGLDGWWAESTISLTRSKAVANKEDKVVKLIGNSEWNELGLAWKEKVTADEEIPFTDFVDT